MQKLALDSAGVLFIYYQGDNKRGVTNVGTVGPGAPGGEDI